MTQTKPHPVPGTNLTVTTVGSRVLVHNGSLEPISSLEFDAAHALATALIEAANGARDARTQVTSPYLTRWVVTSVDDGTVLESGTALVLAADDSAARTSTIGLVHDGEVTVDARVDTRVSVTDVTVLERATALAHQQAWVGDNAHDVPGGDVEFDVTEQVVTMGRVALTLKDSTDETDRLYLDHDPQATGPFWVEVEDAITDFFDQVPEGTLI